MTKVTISYTVSAYIQNNQPKGCLPSMTDISELCGIYIYSHNLMPKILVLNANEFIIDGTKYTTNNMTLIAECGIVISDYKGDMHEIESQWWQDELPPYKACCHKINKFCRACAKVNIGDSFEWDFSDKFFREPVRRGFFYNVSFSQNKEEVI